MRNAGIALISAFLSISPALAESRPVEYENDDAGCVIYSVGTIKIGMHFAFPYRRIKSDQGSSLNDWKGAIAPRVGGAFYLKVKNPDFIGKETGHVIVRCLPPGVYEVGDFKFYGSLPGLASYKWSPKNSTAFLFHVRKGEATYIGSFMRAPSAGTLLQPVLGYAGFFVVADRAERDLPIAQSRLRVNMKVVSEVTDVDRFDNPALRTGEP